MFCHYIHDGEDLGDNVTPGVQVLMRFKPVYLRWGDAWQDTDTDDYRWAGVTSGLKDLLYDKFFDTFESDTWFKHPEFTHVFAAASFG